MSSILFLKFHLSVPALVRLKYGKDQAWSLSRLFCACVYEADVNLPVRFFLKIAIATLSDLGWWSSWMCQVDRMLFFVKITSVRLNCKKLDRWAKITDDCSYKISLSLKQCEAPQNETHIHYRRTVRLQIQVFAKPMLSSINPFACVQVPEISVPWSFGKLGSLYSPASWMYKSIELGLQFWRQCLQGILGGSLSSMCL